jgi:hypothetical protein
MLDCFSLAVKGFYESRRILPFYQPSLALPILGEKDNFGGIPQTPDREAVPPTLFMRRS